ncbi:MAG: pilus assembly protein N-terminal domain-containing protein [Archangium sp.]
MSDDINDVPPPPDAELAQFYWRHTRTGEPTNVELARVRPLVTGEPSDGELQRVKAQVVSGTQQPTGKPARRSFLPPELLAVAAVVLLAVLIQLLYLAFKKPEVTTEGTGLVAVTAAYRAGDLEGAKRLAGSSCTDANCASVSAKLLRAMELTAKFESLSDIELDELAKLDEVLSGGVATELTEAIAKRRVNKGNGAQPQQDFVREAPNTDAMYAEARALERENKPAEAMAVLEKCLAVDPKHADCLALRAKFVPPAEQLFNEANAFRKEKNFESAAIRGQTCIRFYPLHAPCYRLLGSTYAAISTRDQSAADMEKAKKYYQRFLEVASADDEYVPKVKAILDQAGESDEPRKLPPQLKDGNYHATLFRLGQQARESGRPFDAARYFRSIVETPGAPNDLVVKAMNELAELRMDARELYLRGYQLKESDPVEAAKYFQQVVEMTPDDDETHQKAKSRLQELKRQTGVPIAQSSMTLKVGQKVTLKFPGLARVALGDPSVLDVRTIGGDQLLLIGSEPGTTTLLLWLTSGQRESRVVTVSK